MVTRCKVCGDGPMTLIMYADTVNQKAQFGTRGQSQTSFLKPSPIVPYASK